MNIDSTIIRRKKVLARRVIIIILVETFCLWTKAYSTPPLMLPFTGGVTWRCDQGNANDPNNVWGYYCYFDTNNDGKKECADQWSNPTHRSGTSMYYAWDFNLGTGDDDLGKPVLAPASGKIVYAKNSNSNWGKVIIIDYRDGTFGKLAHLNSINVTLGVDVRQGQQIGTCGGTPIWPSHIHYQTQNDNTLNGPSIQSRFLDAEENDGIPREKNFYTSMNTNNLYSIFKVGMFSNGWQIENFISCATFIPYSRPFVITYQHNGGIALGEPANEVHLPSVSEIPGYSSSKGVDLCWIQDITNQSGGIPWLTLALNPYKLNLRMGKHEQHILGVVYPIHGRIRDYWRQHYSDYGPPVSNEYFETVNGIKYAVQWFEKGVNNFVKITYNTFAGTFNDLGASSITYGNHLKQSLWGNIGCPNGVCDTGGGEVIIPIADMQLSPIIIKYVR